MGELSLALPNAGRSLDHLVGAGEQRCQNSAHTGTDFKFLRADTV
jgi:hypothetical protein